MEVANDGAIIHPPTPLEGGKYAEGGAIFRGVLEFCTYV